MCTRPLLAPRPHQRYCSPRCRKRAGNKLYKERRRQKRLERQAALGREIQHYLRAHELAAAAVILRGLQSPDPRIRRLAEQLAKKHGPR